MEHPTFKKKLEQAQTETDNVSSSLKKISLGVGILAFSFLAINAGTIVILNKYGDSNPKDLSSSKVGVNNTPLTISCLIWVSIVLKSLNGYRASSNQNIEEVCTKKKQGYWILGIATLLSYAKINH